MDHSPVSADEDIASQSGEANRVSGWFMFCYTFTQFTAWLALLTPIIITLALKVEEITDQEHKAAYLAAILAPGAFGAMLAAPIWGALSDATRFSFGRRRFWIVVGFLLLLCGLLIVAFAKSLPVIIAGWLLCQIGSNANQASLNALMPDFVPPSQRGRMSGLLGLTLPMAYVTGTFLTQFTTENHIAMFLVPWLPCLISVPLLVATVRERPFVSTTRFSLATALRAFLVNPVRSRDYGWAFTSRFLVMLAVSFATTYQVFFMSDVLGIAKGSVARSMFLSTLVTAGLTVVLTPSVGWLSDRIGRLKPFVVGPGLLVAIGVFAISMTSTFPEFLVAIAIVGVGKGIFFAVEFAVCVAVLPDSKSSAKDLGVLQIANSLPQSIAPALAPLFLAIGSGNDPNYTALYMAATVIACAGALAILPIRSVR